MEGVQVLQVCYRQQRAVQVLQCVHYSHVINVEDVGS